jgi:hypothetical protein
MLGQRDKRIPRVDTNELDLIGEKREREIEGEVVGCELTDGSAQMPDRLQSPNYLIY